MSVSSPPPTCTTWTVCNHPQGCVIIFLSYFLALLVKMDATGEANRSALGGALVAVNMLLILAVLWTAWFAIRQMVDDSHEEDKTSND